MNRWRDWWEQALRDLRHAENSLENRDHEWAAFAAHQAGEKALKAIILGAGGEPWGHSVTGLLEALPAHILDATAAPDAAPYRDALVEAASRLDKHYLPARYPNGLPAGYPGKLYTAREAAEAIADADTIVEFCRRHLPG